jgi:predicted aspartyl protease
MKIGTVDASGEALVPLTVEGLGSEGQQHDIVALLETGFDGFLALPPTLIEALDLEQVSREQYMTASGAVHFTGVYEAVVVFGERRLGVGEIVEAAEPLVGVGVRWE